MSRGAAYKIRHSKKFLYPRDEPAFQIPTQEELKSYSVEFQNHIKRKSKLQLLTEFKKGIRTFVLERDGGCTVCGAKANLQLHHIVPRRENGPTRPENLVTLCSYHHLELHHKEG